MIEKVSDVLNAFIIAEKNKLSGQHMPHMPTLGTAYEEITKQGIDNDYTIPKGLNLRVVSGFIKCGDKVIKEQIDAMLVCGEGTQYGITDVFYYSIEKVLCIFEVKKTLNKKDIADAYNHFRNIKKAYGLYFSNAIDKYEIEPNVTVPAMHFSQLTGKVGPKSYDDINSYPPEDKILFYTLLKEASMPVCIIQGYDGHKTEKGLRDSFLDCLKTEAIKDATKVGVPTLPNLIINNNYSLIKTNGMPFLALDEKQQWSVLASSRSNPIRLMLEIIWTKISVYFDLPMPWGEDLNLESLAPLLVAIPTKVGSGANWKYITTTLSESSLCKEREDKSWKPVKINDELRELIYLITCKDWVIKADDINYIATKYNKETEFLRKQIISCGLFALDKANEQYETVYKTMYMQELENGQAYISFDSNRLKNWLEKKRIAHNFTVLTAL